LAFHAAAVASISITTTSIIIMDAVIEQDKSSRNKRKIDSIQDDETAEERQKNKKPRDKYDDAIQELKELQKITIKRITA